MNEDNQQTISADTIANPPQQIDLAPTQTLNQDALLASLNTAATGAQQYVDQAAQQADRFSAENVALMRELGGESAYRAMQAEQQGLNAAQAEAIKLNKQVLAQPAIGAAKLLQAERDVTGTGVTTASLGRRLSNRERDNAIETLVLSAQANIAQGNVEIAQNLVDQAVSAKYDPIRQDLQIAQFNLNRMDQAVARGDIKLTAAENRLFQTQKDIVQQQEADIRQAEQMTTQILKNNPPSNIKNALLQAKSVGDINAIPGIQNYLMSDAEKLDLALKRAQLAKAQAAAAGPSAEQISLNRAEAKQDVDLLNNIRSNQAGLQRTTGVGRFQRGIADGGISLESREAGAEFKSQVSQVLGSNFVKGIIDAKERGATFGALSEQEGAKLGASISFIEEATIRGKDGKIKGFNISEEVLYNELSRLQEGAELNYIRNGGIPDQDFILYDSWVGEQAMEAINAVGSTGGAYQAAGYTF